MRSRITQTAHMNPVESHVMGEHENPPLTGGFRRRLNHVIILSAIAIILNALFNSFALDNHQPNQGLKAGDRFPAFSLKTIDGATVSEKNFMGKPSVYYFFASWCPCAHDTVKWIKRMQAENEKTGLAILGVGILDSPEKLAVFASKHMLRFPVVAEDGRSLAHSAGMETTPTTVFVDRSGVIRRVHIGKIDRYEQALEGLAAINDNGEFQGLPRAL